MEGGTKNPELASWGQDLAPLLTVWNHVKKKIKSLNVVEFRMYSAMHREICGYNFTCFSRKSRRKIYEPLLQMRKLGFKGEVAQLVSMRTCV